MSSKPLKHNYLNQLKGRYVTDNRSRNNNRVESFSRPILPSNSQKMALQKLFNQETNLYNNFVENLQVKFRGSPEFIKMLTDRHRALFCALSRISFDIKSLKGKKSANTELPQSLEPFRDLLFGIRGELERGMPETFSIFYEMCAYNAMVLYDTKESMAYELIDFYHNQVSTKQQNMSTLEVVTPLQKRHIQVRKPHVNIAWNEKKGISEVSIPHLRNPIKMEANVNDFTQWNLIIIHKDPTVLDIGTDLEWEINFRNTQSKYLIKYIETPNPISKMKSRFVGNR